MGTDIAAAGVGALENGRTVSGARGLRWFFVALGLVYLLVAIAGFAPSYVEFLAGTFEMHWFAHLHGGLMAGWLLLYISQATLVAARSTNLHRRLGLAAIALGIAIWLSMVIASVRVRLVLDPPVGHFLWDVFAREAALIVLFPVFFAWGVAKRRDAAAHKRLMTLATAVLMQPAIDRMQWIAALGSYSPIFYLLYPLLLYVLLAPLVAFDLVTRKRVHAVTLAGMSIVLLAHIIVFQLTGSPAWHEFAHRLLPP